MLSVSKASERPAPSGNAVSNASERPAPSGNAVSDASERQGPSGNTVSNASERPGPAGNTAHYLTGGLSPCDLLQDRLEAEHWPDTTAIRIKAAEPTTTVEEPSVVVIDLCSRPTGA